MSTKIIRNVDAILEVEIADGIDWRWYREEDREPEGRGMLYGNSTDEGMTVRIRKALGVTS